MDMRTSRSAVGFLSVLGLLAIALATPASAQGGNWISIVSIHDVTGNFTLRSGQPLLTGHSYNMTLTVNVPAAPPSATFTMSLYPGVNASGNQYWYVHGSYAGYNASTTVAGSKSITLTWVKGVLSLSALFTLPKVLTTMVLPTSQQGITLHFNQVNFQLVNATITGGSQVGSASVTISDESIQDYLSLYNQTSSYIPTGKIDKSYGVIVNGTLAQAQQLYQKGLVIEATNLLNTINTAEFPAPPSNTLMLGLFAGVGVLAVLVVLFAILALRSRARSGFSSGLVNDVQKELAALEVVAVKYDKSLADKLKGLREKLTEAVS
jgi:hypothetical protein